MQKLSILLISSLVCSSAAAIPSRDVSGMPLREALSVSKPLRHHIPSGTNIFATPETVVAHSRNHSSMFKAPARVSAPVSDEIITERPEGELTLYSRSSIGYLNFYGYIMTVQDYGSAVEVINGTDGKVYLSNPFSQFDLNAYLEATVDGDILTIRGGQAVYEEDYGGYIYTYYAYPLEFRVEDPESGSGWLYPTEENVYQYRIEGDSLVAVNPDITLGLCAYTPGEEDSVNWSGYGDEACEMHKHTAVVPEAPDGLATEPWALLSGDTAYFVNVGVDGNDIWVNGLISAMPGNWTKFTSDGAGKATIANGTYAGIYGNHFAYYYGAVIEEEYDEYYDEYFEVVNKGEDFVFNYDSDAKSLSSEGGLALSTTTDEWCVADYFNGLTIIKQNRVVGTLPADPYDLEVMPFNEEYGYGTISGNLPFTDVEGNLLDTDRMYYHFIVDGEPFEFYTDEYERIPEDMVNVPYNYNDNWDIIANGQKHGIYFYFEGVDTLGFQTFYNEEDGSVLESKMVEIEYDSKVNAVLESKTVKSRSWVDLNGRALSTAPEGICIEKVTYTDGSVLFRKVVR